MFRRDLHNDVWRSFPGHREHCCVPISQPLCLLQNELLKCHRRDHNGSNVPRCRVVSSRGEAGLVMKFITLLSAIVTLTACIVAFFPIYWMVYSSVLPINGQFSWPPRLLVGDLRFDNFIAVLNQRPIFTWSLTLYRSRS